jgi:hypothetical protein
MGGKWLELLYEIAPNPRLAWERPGPFVFSSSSPGAAKL